MNRPLAVPVDEAADMLGVSESMMWKLIGEDVVRRVKIGRRTLIRVAELERFLDDAENSEAPALIADASQQIVSEIQIGTRHG